MKRVGYITDKDGRRITLLEAMGDYGNIQKAYNKARKCKRHRKDVLIFTKDKEENLDKVREDIINLAYEPREMPRSHPACYILFCFFLFPPERVKALYL